MTIIPVTGPSHLSTLLSTSTYVVADFYADWCGPCKAIAPVFAHLATAESQRGRMTFVKIDVDAQQSIAKSYGVSAMPTFLILKNGAVVNTLRGADPGALRSAVLSAAADAAKSAPKASASFASKGHTLGTGTSPAAAKTATVGPLMNGGFLAWIIRFLALYFTTLFSLDPHAAAEASRYNVRAPR